MSDHNVQFNFTYLGQLNQLGINRRNMIDPMTITPTYMPRKIKSYPNLSEICEMVSCTTSPPSTGKMLIKLPVKFERSTQTSPHLSQNDDIGKELLESIAEENESEINEQSTIQYKLLNNLEQIDEQQVNIITSAILEKQYQKTFTNEQILTQNELQSNIEILSQIRENDKLISEGNQINIDNRYFQGLRRRYCKDGRAKTLSMIEKIIDSIDYYNTINAEYIEIDLSSLVLKKCCQGMINLKITYNTDNEFKFKMDTYIKKLQALCANTFKL